MSEFGVPDLDLGIQQEPDGGESAIPSCKECGVIINWSGRGKKPEFCSAHKSGKSRSATGVPSTSTDKIIDALAEMYGGIGLAVGFIVDGNDGKDIVMNSIKLAESWRDLIDNDPKVKKMMAKMVQASGWSTVIVAHASVAIPIAMRHSGKNLNLGFAGANDPKAA